MATVYDQTKDNYFQGGEATPCRTTAVVVPSDTVDFASYPKQVVFGNNLNAVVLPLKNSDGANAVGTLTLVGQPSNTQTVTIGAKTYTFQTVLTNVDGNVFIGATFAITLANLQAALTLGAGAGTTYAAATTAHTTVAWTATTATTLSVAAILPGTAGNALASTTTITGASWSATTLLGGVAPAYVTLTAPQAGYVIPFRVRRVNAVGTTATLYALND